ncbi:spindle apparatus protein lin-5 [Solanum pennellii]|uniref:Spindle apparatus protein lin-5 n=1 Tax=Solanum pennellii TaxID=28526 RepID=A0ABM1GKB1_SOLPN|nr:spindle apparatus protein lin-5 [Solanum pennellii]
MAKSKKTKNSSDREKWNKVFNALVHMLTSQQTQLESLAKERMILEDRIKLQNDRWVSDIHRFQEQIYEMRKKFTIQEMERMLEVAKSEFVVGLKQRDVAVFQRKLENADSELADFREWFDYLSQRCSEPNDVPNAATNEKSETRKKAWEDEVRRLKTENEKLTSEKNSEISALLAEKNFIWNQFNKLEHDMTEQLRRKCTELEYANGKIQAFTRNIEELQLSNADKDNTIAMLRSQLDNTTATLRSQMAKLESDSVTKSGEISKLSTELVFLKKCRSASVTPVLRHSTTGSGPSKSGGTSRGTDQRNINVKVEKQSSQALEKGQRSSKRKAGNSILSAPNLFTSSFKVPKLKMSSPCVT